MLEVSVIGSEKYGGNGGVSELWSALADGCDAVS